MLRLRLFAFIGILFACNAQAQSEYKPFVLPWDDVDRSITDLSGLSAKPAGKFGFIGIDKDGHFVEGGKRIRFLGVNLVATSCFPAKEKADILAGRMAKYGINNARFHHMDARWGNEENLIDYKSGNGSSTLSPERLDRMFYLIAKLKEHGIYSNINLLVSRSFAPEDGLPPEIKNMPWKEKHVIGVFNDRMFELEKNYAKDLLATKNPYTGLTLAEDPSVSIVEIMNENGIIHSWLGDKLDVLPQVFRLQLQEKWNEWLAKKYKKDDEVLKAWKAVDETLGENVLRNGNFAGKTTNDWIFEKHHGAVAEINVETEGEVNAVTIDVKTPGTENWHVQANQYGLELEKDQVYTLSFRAKASAEIDVNTVFQNAKTYKATEFRQSSKVGGEWKAFSQTFKSASSEKGLRLNFSGFGDKVAKVWLADIKLQKGGKIGCLDEGSSVLKRNIPILKHAQNNSTFEMKQDWLRFLSELESDYWVKMKDYVQKTLGYKGVVIGSIIANSPPNIQGEMDAIDGHAYWAHPHFPGKAWDINNWFIETGTMADFPHRAIISNLSGQRVKGKPFTVTEYQHAFPNLYSSEAPLFVGAYGAFQDWDGIWMFDYGSGADQWDQKRVAAFFDMSQHPTKMANMLLAAQLFRRGDVEMSRKLAIYPLPPEREIDVMAKVGHSWDPASAGHLGMPFWVPLTQRVALEIGKAANGENPVFDTPANDQKIYVSDTKQIKWDASNGKGFLTIDTPRTKALIGTPQGEFQWGDGISVVPSQGQWMTGGITITEGKNFDSPQGWNGFAIFSGRTENTGMGWKDEKKNFLGNDWGKAPSIVEMVPLQLKLPYAAKRVSIFALGEKGERKNPIPVKGTEKESIVELGKGDAASLWYEIAVAPGR